MSLYGTALPPESTGGEYRGGDGRSCWFPQTVWEIGKLLSRCRTMTVLLCEPVDDERDYDTTTRLQRPRHNTTTTPAMNEIDSDETLLKYMSTKGTRPPVCADGTARKTRKCASSCVRSKGDRGGGTETAAPSYCDPVQKSAGRSSAVQQQHDRGSDGPRQCACNKTADGRGQCARTGRYAANGTRNYRPSEGQCTSARNYSRAANDGQCTSTGNYNVTANDGQCTSTGNYNRTSDGCSCVTCAAGQGANVYCRVADADGLLKTVFRWSRAAVDWTWAKKSHFLVAAVSFVFGMYADDCCQCACEDML